MNKQRNKTLALSIETLKILTASDLTRARGGAAAGLGGLDDAAAGKVGNAATAEVPFTQLLCPTK